MRLANSGKKNMVNYRENMSSKLKTWYLLFIYLNGEEINFHLLLIIEVNH